MYSWAVKVIGKFEPDNLFAAGVSNPTNAELEREA